MFKGNPTKYLKGVAMKAKRGAQHLEKQKSEDNEVSNCNSKWSQTVAMDICGFQSFSFVLEIEIMHHLLCNRDDTRSDTTYMRKYCIVLKRQQNSHWRKSRIIDFVRR
jgi:hypothetical protein